MSVLRAIPIHAHTAVEVVAAPLLLVAPFALGFSFLAGATSIALAVALTGLALSIYGHGERGSLTPQAHAGFDYVFGAVAIGLAVLVGFLAGDYAAGVFMLGFGSAHLALTASTRFSRPLGA